MVDVVSQAKTEKGRKRGSIALRKVFVVWKVVEFFSFSFARRQTKIITTYQTFHIAWDIFSLESFRESV